MTAPTLVIHEPAFPFGSFELCQEVAAAIPGAEFLIVNDHSIAGRIHDETVAGIDRFLRGVTTTGRLFTRRLRRPATVLRHRTDSRLERCRFYGM